MNLKEWKQLNFWTCIRNRWGWKGYERYCVIPNKTLTDTLLYLDDQYGLGKLYYPGSGFHVVPREVLGEDRVIHLSQEREKNYFYYLGEGIKVKGDFRESPFKDNSFDSTLIWSPPFDTILEAIPEFKRVTKEGGLVIVGTDELYCYSTEHFVQISQSLNEHFRLLSLPDFCSGILAYQK